MEQIRQLAASNFKRLRNSVYTGRGLVVGLDESGENLVQIYWITGRSAGSRNRVLRLGENGRVYTEVADPAKFKGNPSLTIYNAMREGSNCFVVSNGAQTDAVVAYEERNVPLEKALEGWVYEPDDFHTPRISAFFYRNSGGPAISINRKSPFDEGCDRTLHKYGSSCSGIGWCVTTYSGDTDSPITFDGQPYLMPINGNQDQVLGIYWDALDNEHRVSLAVKFVGNGGSVTLIKNQYAREA